MNLLSMSMSSLSVAVESKFRKHIIFSIFSPSDANKDSRSSTIWQKTNETKLTNNLTHLVILAHHLLHQFLQIIILMMNAVQFFIENDILYSSSWPPSWGWRWPEPLRGQDWLPEVQKHPRGGSGWQRCHLPHKFEGWGPEKGPAAVQKTIFRVTHFYFYLKQDFNCSYQYAIDKHMLMRKLSFNYSSLILKQLNTIWIWIKKTTQ